MKSVEVKELGAEIEFKLNFAVFYDFFLTVQPKKRFFFAFSVTVYIASMPPLMWSVT